MLEVEGAHRLSPAEREVLRLRAVVELIRLVVGVAMTEQGVGLWLRRRSWAPKGRTPVQTRHVRYAIM